MESEKKEFKLESAEHFVNIIRNVRKKRGFSTYIPSFEIALFTDAFNTNEKICFNYLMFLRAELKDNLPDTIHFIEFIKLELGLTFVEDIMKKAITLINEGIKEVKPFIDKIQNESAI